MKIRPLLAALALVALAWAAWSLLRPEPAQPAVKPAGPEQPDARAHRPERAPAISLVDAPSVDRSTVALESIPTGPEDATPPPEQQTSAQARPDLIYKIQVLTGAGRPVPGARLHLYCGTHQSHRSKAIADQTGSATIKFDVRCEQSDAFVRAYDDGAGLAAEPLLLPAPQEGGSRSITLQEGAILAVRVREEPGGREVPGATLSLHFDARLQQRWGRGKADDQGQLRLGPLPPGPVHWWLQPPYGEHKQQGSIELQPGEVRELELYLAGDGLALALEGRFLDIHGEVRNEKSMSPNQGNAAPDRPHLWVGASLTDGRPVHPDYLGRFRLYRKPCEELLVLLNAGPTGHRYAPVSMTVPFGTRGLELRPIETFDSIRSTFHVTSAATGEPLNGAGVRLFIEEPMREQESQIVKREGPGLFAIAHRAWPELQYVVWHEDHQHHFGRLPASSEGPIEVALEPGIRSPLRVCDAATQAPIAGVRFRNQDGEVLATTDASGEAILEGPRAAGKLDVTAEGYSSRRWYASWYTNLLYLDAKKPR